VRIYDLERQDKSQEDGNYTMTQYTELMYLLSEGNLADKYGHAATLAYGFDKYVTEPPRSILEIGYGLGNFSIMLSKKYSGAKVVGIDSHAHSVTVANNYLAERKRDAVISNGSDPSLWENLSLEYRENPQLSEPDKQFDIIVTNFVNHHIFPDEEFELFLKQVGRVGRRYFIFNDFERSLFCIAANHLLFSSFKKFGANVVLDLASKYSPFPMSADAIESINAYKRILDSGLRSKESLDLLYDGGMLSMRRSFSMREYRDMFKRAGYPEDSLKCHSMFNLSDPISYTCRVVCVVDLSGYNA
jgi:ubiquinone/menaquinone biosynthesis C-methylase UbiE